MREFTTSWLEPVWADTPTKAVMEELCSLGRDLHTQPGLLSQNSWLELWIVTCSVLGSCLNWGQIQTALGSTDLHRRFLDGIIYHKAFLCFRPEYKEDEHTAGLTALPDETNHQDQNTITHSILEDQKQTKKFKPGPPAHCKQEVPPTANSPVPTVAGFVSIQRKHTLEYASPTAKSVSFVID